MRSGEPEETPSRRLKRASTSMFCSWIANTWACIPEKIICLGFKKCSILNVHNGTEDKLLLELISDKGLSEESASNDDD
ncbi:hypothetical protein HPB49_004697 [Dermacentor silvarum]|uniref:Uncharacterized protein n=1 Tax=Dermacentor silvarum TaxID=543639 RepID=A0ACB8DUU3_DERSI|nr:hypothetical protein HPB49_004697 [Dermacentor silvarum]